MMYIPYVKVVLSIMIISITKLCECEGLKILLVPAALRSHVFEMAAIGEKLAGLGHTSSLVLPRGFPFNYTRPGLDVLTYTDLGTYRRTGNTQDISTDMGDVIFQELFVRGDHSLQNSADHLTQLLLRDCEKMLTDPNLSRSIETKQYDIALVDAFIYSYCNFLLPFKHGIPFASSFSGGVIALQYRIPELPSFSPFPRGNLGYSSKMTFIQRVKNSFISLAAEYFPPHKSLKNFTLLHKYAPEVPTWMYLLRMSELFFIHRDLPLERPYVSMSNVIRTPGVTIREGRALPSHIQDIITGSDKLVIVTFGSIISTISDEILGKIFRAFSAFPHFLFLMRMNDAQIPGWRERVPDHVRLLPWLPQQDLLADNRTVLFLTHGGSNGRWEAVYHSVPLVCMPIFSEQNHNCRLISEKNISVTINLFHFTPSELSDAITMVTTDPRFSQGVSRGARMIREAPMTSAEVMSHWLNHVVKYGSEHLRPRSLDMTLVEFLMIDVAVFVFLAFLTAAFFTRATLTYIWMHFCQSQYPKVKSD